jgi:hypothetical protein
MTNTTTDAAEARAAALRALIAKATQEDLTDDGRYFAETYADLTRCRHQEIGEYEHSPDGKLVEWLWNKRQVIADLLATAEAVNGAGEREGAYVAGPIWAEPEDDCFTAEIQTVGGHAVAATVHGGTRDEAERRQAAVLRALASLPPATAPAMVEAADWMEEARKAAAATRPNSPWAKAVMRGNRDDSDEVRAAMLAIDATLTALAAAPTIPATGEAVPKPLRVDWNKHDLAEAYDLVEGVRSKMAQSPESSLDTSLRAALDAIEAADCEWDGITKATIPATGHAATEGEGASHADRT